MRLIVNLLIFCLAVGTLQSCVSKKKYDELTAAKVATDEALAETQGQVKTLQEEKDALAAEMEAETTRMTGEIEGIRNELNTTKGQVAEVQEKLNMTEAELEKFKQEINGIFAAYTESGMSLQERDGRLYVVSETPFTFRSGSSRLTSEERNAIDKMAATLKNNPKAAIVVEGHTDNKQFVAGSARDNWDLSYARAKAVASRLIQQGVDPAQVTVAGKGEYMPVADNNTADGRAQNRRTVIMPDASGILVPLMDEDMLKPSTTEDNMNDDGDDDNDDDGTEDDGTEDDGDGGN